MSGEPTTPGAVGDTASTATAPETDRDDGDASTPLGPAPSAASGNRSVAWSRPAWLSSERMALGVFVAFVVVAAPLILFHYGAYHWFFRDDFIFLADRKGTFPDFLAPHGGAHWVAVPKAIYFVLWQLFGMTTYVPYQACVVALHLTAVVLLRAIMRRAGVGPWLASAAAAVLVLFGPGAQNIVWAFQVSFTGSLAYGLAQLVLADHDGPLDRRDALGLGFGALAIMSSGVGLTMALVVGIAVLLRRGWRMAAAHTLPLGALYGVWSLVAHPDTTGPFGRPTIGVLFSWVRSAQIGTFRAMGHFPVVAGLFAILLLVGLVLAVGPWRQGTLAETRRRLSMPVALFLGGLAFAASTGLGRWFLGAQGARASRYLYLGAAFTLPLLAVAAQELTRRWRALTPVLAGLFVVVIPFNLSGFTPQDFGKAYMDQRRYVLTTAVRMPFANQVPPDVQPLPDPFASEAVTMGFLRTAERNGDLDPSTFPIGPKATNEFKVRLGVSQHRSDRYAASCRTITGAEELSPSKGDELLIGDAVQISTGRGSHRTGPSVTFDPQVGGNRLDFELANLHLLITPARGATSYRLCQSR